MPPPVPRNCWVWRKSISPIWLAAFLCNPALPPRTRTRGRLRNSSALQNAIGNTPTHVGKTPSSRRRPDRTGKHPHARGEDYSLISPLARFSETPPRTWGRLFVAITLPTAYGNTPTHVGKTGWGKSALIVYQETPPRTWGRLYIMVERGQVEGNTPTHVGKTISVGHGLQAF